MECMERGRWTGTGTVDRRNDLGAALDNLGEVAASTGLRLNPEGRDQLRKWAGLVVEWRSAARLTAVASASEVVRALMIPALYALPLLQLKPDMTIVDVGCGSGSTGAALAVVARKGEWLLVDRAEKKVTFCRYATGECRMGNVRVLSLAEYLRSGRRADVVLARGLPKGRRTFATIRAAASPRATVVQWVTGGEPSGGSVARCGALELWVVATDIACFT